jgi:hypothetical protein
MRILTGLCLMMCVVTAAFAARTKSTLLQTVEVEGMSTDGGEAKLYHANTAALAPCRMDVMIYGEHGRAGFVFMFGSRLLAATRTEYRYNLPYYMKNGGRVASTHSVTLRSTEGRKQLQAAFRDFKPLFDPRNIAQCEEN